MDYPEAICVPRSVWYLGGFLETRPTHICVPCTALSLFCTRYFKALSLSRSRLCPLWYVDSTSMGTLKVTRLDKTTHSQLQPDTLLYTLWSCRHTHKLSTSVRRTQTHTLCVTHYALLLWKLGIERIFTHHFWKQDFVVCLPNSVIFIYLFFEYSITGKCQS